MNPLNCFMVSITAGTIGKRIGAERAAVISIGIDTWLLYFAGYTR